MSGTAASASATEHCHACHFGFAVRMGTDAHCGGAAMSLAVQAALALALQCAPSVDPRIIVAIGQRESGLEPLTIHDNTTGQSLRGEGVTRDCVSACNFDPLSRGIGVQN
jgi:hypothetical protein